MSKNARVSRRRVDAVRTHVDNPWGVPMTLFANDEVPIEEDALRQAVSLSGLSDTLAALSDEGTFGPRAAVEQMVLTPDFHPGATIPVGTVLATRDAVVPQAIGSDICCGMRMLLTDIRPGELPRDPAELKHRLRHIFFGGGRDIPLSPVQREALLRDGLHGLHEARADNRGVGTWAYYDDRGQLDDLERVHHGAGELSAPDVFSFADYVRSSGRSDGRDAQIGSVGGGNHFVEIQVVEQVHDGATAHLWGVEPDRVAIMIHTGSLGFGQQVSRHFLQKARELYPRGRPHPEHGFYGLPMTGEHGQVGRDYWAAMSNAANFAYGNRLFLGLMAIRALSEALGRSVDARLLHDVPHNLVWQGEDGQYVHRKGACPAPGADPQDAASPFRYTGRPVIVPGSMGAPSFVLAGQGSQEALESASHGAGRQLSRGAARHTRSSGQLAGLHVVGPVDPEAPEIRARPEIAEELRARLLEERPEAYKPVTPIIETIEGAGIARRVARVSPWLTIKG